MKNLVAVLCLFCSSLAFAEVYKCKNADGSFAFQETPCQSKEGEKVRIWRGPPAAETQQRSNYYQREKERLDIKHEFDYAIASREIRVGMTEDMVRESWGSPNKINTTVFGGGKSEQWVYYRGKVKSEYVYIQNGVVTSFQTSN